MDWDGLCEFLQEIRRFLEAAKSDKRDLIAKTPLDSLIDKCEFYISTTIKLGFNDEVDLGKGGTYLNMTPKMQIDNTPQDNHGIVVL